MSARHRSGNVHEPCHYQEEKTDRKRSASIEALRVGCPPGDRDRTVIHTGSCVLITPHMLLVQLYRVITNNRAESTSRKGPASMSHFHSSVPVRLVPGIQRLPELVRLAGQARHDSPLSVLHRVLRLDFRCAHRHSYQSALP